MKLWIDDIREAPNGWIWCKSVNEAKSTYIEYALHAEEISLDHDAGDFANDGGDFIEFLNWLEKIYNTNPNAKEFHMDKIKFSLHSMNPVGVENMRRIIQRNGWKEV